MIWAMATKTHGFKVDNLGTPTQDSLGAHFLSKAITASARLHEYRAQVREQGLGSKFDTTLTLQQYMRRLFHQWEHGREPEKPTHPRGTRGTRTTKAGTQTRAAKTGRRRTSTQMMW